MPAVASSGVSGRRMGRFLLGHLGYALFAPALMIVGTVVHEAAHAAVGLALGGRVLELHVWPELGPHGFRFGHVLYDRHFGELQWLVTMAPALAWTAIALASIFWIGRVSRPRIAKTCLLFCFLLPLADISMQLAGLYCNSPASDYYKVLAEWKTATGVAAVLYFGGFAYAGWRWIFRAIFGDALSAIEYTLGLLAILALPWLPLAYLR